jgi:putative redox protein
MQWVGGHAFEGGRAGGPQIVLDGKAARGPSPVDSLLLALIACTGYDIVDILEKRRTPIEAMSIAGEGVRHDGVPARITHITLTYDITGAGIEQVHAERAVELAVTKYCSVRDSLDPNLPIETIVRVHSTPPAPQAV